MSEVAAAGLRRNDPAAFEHQVKDGYIKGVIEHRPAVISVNMFASALAVSELLARLHPFREEHNSAYAAVSFSLSSMEIFYDPEEGMCEIFGNKVGYGDTTPLLGMMELAERRKGGENDEGYLVDLIRPIESDLRKEASQKIGQGEEELYAVGIHGLQWLVNAPKVEETVIGSDGMPIAMSCFDPRAFALHKLWLSRRVDRAAAQRPRDSAQAAAVAALVMTYLRLPFDSRELSALPKELRELAPELKKMAKAWLKENPITQKET